MYLNVFTQCSPSPQLPGWWRHEADRTAEGYRTFAYWTALARQLERACIDVLFFADSHGVFDVYRGTWGPAVRHGVQIPSIDPLLVVSAAAAATERLGFAVTYSTTYHAPYECARVFSSLDHLTGGRIAWNLVTSYLESAIADGLGERLPHDDRYARADEYMAVVRALWEESWQDDAVVRDAARDIFTDADRVRDIAHDGRWFSVRGPHQCEPSPQRTPVIYQAGASPRGTEFAARHAEVVFVTLTDARTGAATVTELRRAAERLGRASDALKILHGTLVIVGRTREEAKAKANLFSTLTSFEGELAKWCGWAGFDLAAYPDDAVIAEIRSEGSRSVLRTLQQTGSERTWTIGDLRYFILMGQRPRRRHGLVGTAAEVADTMQEWIDVAGIDGFNLLPCPPSAGVDDICDLLVPELQRRGAFRRAYDPAEQTLRERYFGAGRRHYDGRREQGSGADHAASRSDRADR